LSLEYLQKIKEKENQAEKIRQDCVAETAKIINLARDEAAVIIDKANSEATAHYNEVIKKAHEEAAEDYEKITHQTMWECDMLSENAEKYMDQAVTLIVKKVVDPWQ
jgi:hypothetical protein